MSNSQKQYQETNKTLLKITNLIEYGQQAIYILTGVAFLFLGAGILIYSIIFFFSETKDGYLHATLILMSDLMLLLIILEVMETIINHLKYHTVLLEPFLYMGIIAAIRKILSAGAKVALTEDVSKELFDRYIFDIGTNALVILALAIALYLFTRKKEQRN